MDDLNHVSHGRAEPPVLPAERVYEQSCLYELSCLSSSSPELLFQKAVQRLIQAFPRQPDAVVKITWGGQSYLSGAQTEAPVCCHSSARVLQGQKFCLAVLSAQMDSSVSADKQAFLEKACDVLLGPFSAPVLGEENTALKRVEQALVKSYLSYAYITRATFDAVWDWDLRSDRVDWGGGSGNGFWTPAF